MMENAVYSVISPEGCASILWKDSSKASEAADVLKLTAHDLHKFGVIEKIIDEKDRTPEEVSDELKNYIVTELEKSLKKSVKELLDGRYNKFRRIGEY